MKFFYKRNQQWTWSFCSICPQMGRWQVPLHYYTQKALCWTFSVLLMSNWHPDVTHSRQRQASHCTEIQFTVKSEESSKPSNTMQNQTARIYTLICARCFAQRKKSQLASWLIHHFGLKCQNWLQQQLVMLTGQHDSLQRQKLPPYKWTC